MSKSLFLLCLHLFQQGNSSKGIFFVAKHMLHLLVLTGFGVLNLAFYIERCLHVGLVYKKIVEYSESERGYYICESKVFNMHITQF